MHLRRCLLRGTLVAACLALAGCATTLSAPSAGDPWERVNRSTDGFNDAIDRAVLKPVAHGYRRVVPDIVRTGISNFLSNLAYPTTLVNNLLQLKLKDALSDTARLVLNTTLGLGGLLDPATEAGLARNDEDFGQTLGRWGVPSGPYLVIPFLGPSTLRDTPALYPDYLTDGQHYVDDSTVELVLSGLTIVDRRARYISVEEALEGAFDRYALMRNAFLQRREYMVRDGDVPAEPPEEEFWLEEDEAATPPLPGP